MGSASKRKGIRGTRRANENGGAFGNTDARWTMIKYWLIKKDGSRTLEEACVRLNAGRGFYGARIPGQGGR